ncbi:LLM class flavin-dependent oxidoreductase [Amycolatopsis suaedae]|uniref:LLM class flavin-dependent oxidoreductase n=1 Tax=Amycolatopsis suaedae TaxID=2510978 RepID=A0A4Q7J0Z5_9PSEU|nr:LLM class flavin-dependent oxidoreductase [Amycolatopsis suaedae]RZQ60252.1 LLM class flavin-dependent oxidoreductase [Amycolatopsis suaedae]
MRRFGVIVMPDAPATQLTARFRRIEELGFDQLYLADHIGDFRDLSGPFLDGWSLLAAAAVQTSRIALGPLVNNPILREPAVLAKQAMTVDQLSRGRLELGLGAGVFESDHQAVGSRPWPVRERVGRFAEYTAIVDGILRADGKPFTFEGDWYRVRDVPTAPGPVRRPPIIVGGQAPTLLRVAAERADIWNSNGQFGAPVDEIVARTREQNARLDELCLAAGRDPSTLRRQFLLWDTTDPLAPGASLEDLVGRLSEAGIEAFVLGWPETPRQAEKFERLAAEVIPALR